MIPITEIKFNKKSDMIFPVTVYSRQGKYSADAYTESIGTVREAEKRFDDILSEESIKFIEKSVASLYAKYGFEFYFDDGGLFSILECTENSIIVQDTTDIADLSCDYDGSLIETIDTKEAAEFGQRGKVIVDNGKIVCVCVENYIPDCEYIEIAVETAKDYRNRGYAKRCVYALTRELLSEYDSVRYMCHTENELSINTAKSVGFTETSKEYYFIMAKEEN